MTRTAFENDITDWSELMEVCWDVGYEVCADIVDMSDSEDLIKESIREYLRYSSWVDLAQCLSDMPEEGYCRYNGGLDFTPLDEADFENYKTDVCWYMDDQDLWDDDDEEDEEEDHWVDIDPVSYDDEADDDEDFIIKEDMSLATLMSSSVEQLNIVIQMRDDAEHAAEADFRNYITA